MLVTEVRSQKSEVRSQREKDHQARSPSTTLHLVLIRKMGRNPVLLGRLYIFDLLPPWDWLARCAFVLHFQRDNYRLKLPSPVRIVFCSFRASLAG
ncbi:MULTISPECIES: hypothetical protein [unclassified Microcoleus]|uniref:hypothetical protein n=1 Tax=unclassified Microcoleus TaxID=2642155 RepID=UPI002FD23DC0